MASDPRLRMPVAEFVALIGVMMAVGALSLDMMLPALGVMGEELGVTNPNRRQEVITAFLVGIGIGQLFYGPLSDLYGRKRMLLIGLAIFIAASLWATVAHSFEALLAARALQGFGAAAPRVISAAVVRDLFVGDRMARVMSFAMLVFIVVPIFAPALGMAVLLVADWPAIFLFTAAFALVLALWSGLRLPETRGQVTGPGRGLRARIVHGVSVVLHTRVTMGYSLALGFLFTLLMTYVATAQQVFQDIYQQGERFPLVFGAIAAVIAFANVLNARFVLRYGAARIAMTALWLLVAVTGVLLLLCLNGNPSLPVFWFFMSVTLFLFAAATPNLNALAMEPMGPVAGTASSFIGFFTTLMASGLGWLIGSQLDDRVLPIAAGFFVAALAAAVVVRGVQGKVVAR
jgi:DHA1 family bicyclomycin/chloramphenicol resistance-like MFS transporter